MDSVASAVAAIVERSAASFPMCGQEEAGDCSIVQLFDDEAFVDVVDGVRPGEKAVLVAFSLTIDILRGYAFADVLEKCHRGFRGSRGAVVSLVLLNVSNSRITWLGIRNIEGLLLSTPPRADVPVLKAREALLLRIGIVGFVLPRLSVSATSLTAGDLPVFAKDDIHYEFADAIHTAESTEQISRCILGRYASKGDIRFSGPVSR